MTPIQQMTEAATRHPMVTARLSALRPEDRELHVNFLRTQARVVGRGADLIALNRILGHLEMQTLSQKLRD